jgi:hypothetical protein
MSQPAPISVPKGYQRLGAFPLDASNVFAALSELETYALTNGTAYVGQICAVSGTGKAYVIQSDKSLLELGSGGETLPESTLAEIDAKSIAYAIAL